MDKLEEPNAFTKKKFIEKSNSGDDIMLSEDEGNTSAANKIVLSGQNLFEQLEEEKVEK